MFSSEDSVNTQTPKKLNRLLRNDMTGEPIIRRSFATARLTKRQILEALTHLLGRPEREGGDRGVPGLKNMKSISRIPIWI